MSSWFHLLIVSLVLAPLIGVGGATLYADVVDEFSADQMDYFERHVRPLLVEHCFECHGADKQEGSLRLDRRATILSGGDRGPSAVPGQASHSLLIRAVAYDADDLAMPPAGKLSARQIAVLRDWIDQGLPWPPENERAGSPATRPKAVDHWAFQPITRPSIPHVQNTQWLSNPIDAFVLARLEAQGLSPSPPADHVTLVRRLFLDLIGLPPIDVDPHRVPYEARVDQLLSRREYGQRWARHWLDVARYADTKGYVDGGQVQFAFAHTYRDYVIRAMNDDLPLDQFVLDQLAADQRTYADGATWRTAALGFLTVGRRFNHNVHDILDDQIDVISRGLQGLTVTCARCHDHKYDPIPTADYYSLYGILASSYEPHHPDLPVLEADDADTPEHLNELHRRAAKYEWAYHQLHRQIQYEMCATATDYLVYVVQESPEHRQSDQNPLRTSRVYLRGPTAYGYGAIRRWRQYLQNRPDDDPAFGLWQHMMRTTRADFRQQLSKQLATRNINPLLHVAIGQAKPTNMVELAQVYGELLESIYADEVASAAVALAAPHPEMTATDPALRELQDILFGTDSPAVMTPFESIDCYHLDEHTELRNLAGKVEELSIQAEQLSPRAMILRERVEPYEPVVFRRGQPHRAGQRVPRRIPQVFSEITRETSSFHGAPGDTRLALALAIVARDNPLTARVLVNRVWHWHFGQPLVDTVSDFGLRSQPPSHPQLLDYLATWLMDNDWSLKKLHRLIVTSSTYRQASRYRPAAAEADPNNRYLWRFQPRRLEWEVIRDSILAVSGQLRNGGGGRPIQLSPDAPQSNCRTVYLHVDRQHVSSFARHFDFPSPDFTSPQRPITTVPQQQLFFLNSPFIAAHAKSLGERIAAQHTLDTVGKFRWAHQRVLGQPTMLNDAEILELIDELPRTDNDRWESLAQVLLQSTAFVFLE